MMPFSIVIPYRFAGGIREENFRFIVGYYEDNFPEAEIVIGYDDSGAEDFNRGLAINNGVKEASHDILLLNDGDIFIEPSTLEQGFKLLQTSPFVIPWSVCLDITENKTRLIHKNGFKGKIKKLKKHAYMVRDIRPGRAYMGYDKCAGGIQLIRREFFNKIKYDHRLVKWGFEDTLFCLKVKNLIGDYPLVDGYVCHLYHDRGMVNLDNEGLFLDIVDKELENIFLE